jgi:hypothetical protein
LKRCVAGIITLHSLVEERRFGERIEVGLH